MLIMLHKPWFRQNYVLNKSLINIKALIPFIPL